MRLTQGAFSFLPDLTDEQIKLQVEYCIANGWSIIAEACPDMAKGAQAKPSMASQSQPRIRIGYGIRVVMVLASIPSQS